ncbi:MAG: hypothetical protein ACJ76I_07050 [Gaiellaceae bacterium]
MYRALARGDLQAVRLGPLGQLRIPAAARERVLTNQARTRRRREEIRTDEAAGSALRGAAGGTEAGCGRALEVRARRR